MKSPKPAPRLIRWVARWIVPSRDREFVLGDLDELHRARLRRDGAWSAWWACARDVLGSALWGRIRRMPPSAHSIARPSRGALLDPWVHDLRAAFRVILREPGFSAMVVLILALGVGSTTAVFSMVNQLVLRPLPGVSDPQGAVYVQFRSRENPDDINGQGLATLDFDELRVAQDFARGIASYGLTSLHLRTDAEARPLGVRAHSIYGDFFEVLGVVPAEGRLLTAADNAFGADPRVAVISESLQTKLFGAGAEAVGRSLLIGDEAVRIIGVAGNGFTGADRSTPVEMWIPYPSLSALLGFREERLLDRNSVMHDDLVLRLDEGVSTQTAESRIETLLAGIGDNHPEQRDYLANLRPMLFPGLSTPPMWRARTERTLSLLGGIVALVLLVACANVANLLLFRNVRHRGTVAVRRALGASTGRIARGQFAQSLILAVLASGAGLVVAWAISLPLRGQSLLRMPALDGFLVDGRVMGFALLAALATTVLFGTVPSVLAGRFELGDTLRGAGRGDTGPGDGLRRLMAAAQTALSLALLVGGIQLTRTVANLYAVDTGFREDGVALIPMDFPSGYGPEAQEVARTSALAALEAVAGVERAGASLYSPHGSSMMGRITVGALDQETPPTRTEMIPVTSSWFELLDVHTSDGAPLRLDPAAWKPGQVVLTEGLARKLFGSADQAIGRTVRSGFGSMDEAQVVGVTGVLRSPSSPDESREAFMVPYELSPGFGMTLLVRSAALDPSTLEALRDAVGAVLPELPVVEPTTLSARVDRIHAERRLFSRLLGLLSIFAVVLAAAGLYCVIAFAVAARRREFGVRMALGAGRSRIAGQVARFAASIVGLGTLLGLGAGYAVSRVLESRLYGVASADVTSNTAAVLLLGLTGVVACWIPARRAMGVDPITALRSE